MKNITKNFFLFLLSVTFASLIIFFCIEILPGDVAQIILGTEANPQNLAIIRKELGIDKAWYIRYFSWIGDLLKADLGQSYVLEEKNLKLFQERIAVTFALILSSLFLSLTIAYIIGLASFSIRKKIFNQFITSFLQIGVALPSFWIATLLIIFFAVKNQWLPAGNFSGWNFNSWSEFSHSIKYLILPILSLSIPQVAIFTRIIKKSLENTKSEYFIKTAISKGISKKKVLFFHLFPYSQIPIITIVAIQIPFLCTGAILIESVFYLPGVGRLLLQSIYHRDLILVKNAVLLLFILVIFVQFLAKILINFINPEEKKNNFYKFY